MNHLLIIFLLTLAMPLPAWGTPVGDCIPCHREKTPAAVAQWEESSHGRKKIGCEACHGTDHDAIVRGERRVTQSVCGPCHPKAYGEHRRSRHGMGLHSGWGCTRNLPDRRPNECRFCHEEGSESPKSTVSCARFLKQSREMREIGCNGCHVVETSCSSCHTNHMTDLSIVRDPASCAKCHMGPDHPQWEMWETSLHGTLRRAIGGKRAPDCQRCHMPAGSHDVSRGITVTSAGFPLEESVAKRERDFMLGICIECHGAGFARSALESADSVLRQSLEIVRSAEEIVWELHDRKLLDPMPDQRTPHPLAGHRLVTDSQLLYEETSHIERLLFKMKKYDYAKTIKGAFHQNPAYTHWYGNAELKMGLIDIRSEAERLKKLAATGKRSISPEEELSVLKGKLERGRITRDEFDRKRRDILETLIPR